jgi:competence protein ComEA
VSVCLASALLCQGRGAHHEGGPAAFSLGTSAGISIRLRGNIPYPGVYRFSGNPDLLTVINMTAPSALEKWTNGDLQATRLKSGDIVDVVAKDVQLTEISIKKMSARERMVLGIPLIPDDLDLSDWESLPGIGPGLARNIMRNRQDYGDFGSADALQRVPGIGEKKLNQIKRYF